MPQLTARLAARVPDAVAGHLATVERLAAAGEDSTAARAGLGLAERGLALLRGRQRLICAPANPRSTRDDDRGRPASGAKERILRLLARPVARVGAGERTVDRLYVAGYAAVQGIRATAGVAGADEADWA